MDIFRIEKPTRKHIKDENNKRYPGERMKEIRRERGKSV